MFTLLLAAALAIPQEGQVFDKHTKFLEAQGTLANVPITAPTQDETRGSEGFRRALMKGARNLRKRGEISRAQMVRLRVAMLSPAFRKYAEELAVIQIAFSGEESDAVPVDEMGNVIPAAIDWDAIIAFIEKLIPLILMLIEIFSGLGGA
jgi:hypothetical protein